MKARWVVVVAAGMVGLVSGCSASPSTNTQPYPTLSAATVTPSLPGGTPTTGTTSPEASGSPSASPEASGSPSASPTQAAPPQLRYQLDIQDGRGALKGGTAFAASQLAANTNHAIPFNAVICGATSRRCAALPTTDATASASPAPGGPVGLPPKIGDVATGARIRAKLNAADPSVEITELASDATQPIIDDADAAEWEWSIKPTAEGTFALTLRFDVLEANSERLLVPSQTFRITLTATTTSGDRWRDIGRSTWDFLASVTGMIAAVGGASVFTGAAWIWRRFRRRRLVAGITDLPDAGPTDVRVGPRPPVPPTG